MAVALGNYRLHKIEAGYFGLDGGAMFGVVPKPLWEKRIAADERNRIPLAMRCLLLEGNNRVVLIDNGIGDKYTDKFASLYNVDRETNSLEKSLSAAGFSTNDITDVILTHLHFDHAGGTTRRSGDDLELVFPRARHFVQRSQWESANDPNPREAASFLPENLLPLAESDNLVLVDGEGEIMPGLTVVTANGHTDKMQLISIADETQTLVYAADLLPTRHHLGIPWTMAYDIRPLESMTEKESFLDRAVAGNWSIFFEHDVDCEVCSVEKSERGFAPVNVRTLDEL